MMRETEKKRETKRGREGEIYIYGDREHAHLWG